MKKLAQAEQKEWVNFRRREAKGARNFMPGSDMQSGERNTRV